MILIAIIVAQAVLALGIYLLLREQLNERICELMAHEQQTIASLDERVSKAEKWQHQHDTSEMLKGFAEKSNGGQT